MAEVSEKVASIMEAIKELGVLEVKDLADALQEEFGVSAMAAAPVAVAAAPGADAGAAEEKEEQTEFDVILISAGDKKINVIKVVRALTNLGLKEAKELVDSAPKPIKEAVNKADAEDARKQLEEAGATVEVK